MLLKYIGAGLMILSVLAGFVFGTLASIYVWKKLTGQTKYSAISIAVCFPYAALPVMMVAYMAGGLGEDLFGTLAGPTIGVFLGCLVGAFFINLFTGGLGALVAEILKRRSQRS